MGIISAFVSATSKLADGVQYAADAVAAKGQEAGVTWGMMTSGQEAETQEIGARDNYTENFLSGDTSGLAALMDGQTFTQLTFDPSHPANFAANGVTDDIGRGTDQGKRPAVDLGVNV